eukprot:1454418-Rhodomonas_salina.2
MSANFLEEIRKRYAVEEGSLTSTLGIVVRGCLISGIMPGGPADSGDVGEGKEGEKLQRWTVEAQ